jgi:hypothetical protein
LLKTLDYCNSGSIVYRLRQNFAASVADFACVMPPLTLQSKFKNVAGSGRGRAVKTGRLLEQPTIQEALAFTVCDRLGRHPQLLRQLSDVGGDAPRLVFGVRSHPLSRSLLFVLMDSRTLWTPFLSPTRHIARISFPSPRFSGRVLHTGYTLALLPGRE